MSLFILHLIFDNAQPYADQMRNECTTRYGIFTSRWLFSKGNFLWLR